MLYNFYSETPEPPILELLLSRDFETVGQEPITPECLQGYTDNARRRGSDMQGVVNTFIGTAGFCENFVSTDTYIHSVDTTLAVNANGYGVKSIYLYIYI